MPPKTTMEGSISRSRLAHAQEVFQRAKDEKERKVAGVSSRDDKKKPNSLSLLEASALSRTAASSSKKRKGKNKKLSSFNPNLSMSSISEMEPVLEFDQSQCSNMSSLSQLTISNGSLQLSFSNCVTQGPALFDSDSQEKTHTQAPKFPERRASSIADTEFDGEASDSSLSLEDIIEESTSHSTSSNATAITEATTVESGGRQWSETSTSPQAVNMPIRSESLRRKNSQSTIESGWSASSFAEDDGSCSSSSSSSHLSNSTSSFNHDSAASLNDSTDFGL